jgi:hypothetical protein
MLGVEPGPAAIAAVVGAIFVGALIRESLGPGAGLVVAPVLALVASNQLPQVLIASTLALSVVIAIRERSALRPAGLAWLIVGAVPGALAGLVLVRRISGPALQFLFAAIAADAQSFVASGALIRSIQRPEFQTG